MTQLLQKAFEQAAKLPPEAQDALAKALLHDLESENAWGRAFDDAEMPSLDVLASEALKEHRAGRSQPMDLKDL